MGKQHIHILSIVNFPIIGCLKSSKSLNQSHKKEGHKPGLYVLVVLMAKPARPAAPAVASTTPPWSNQKTNFGLNPREDHLNYNLLSTDIFYFYQVKDCKDLGKKPAL